MVELNMKKHLLIWITAFCIGLMLTACGTMTENTDEEVDEFQSNGTLDPEIYANFKLLEVFDGRGALEEIWDSIDAKQTNPRLECTVDKYPDDFVTFSNVAAGILRADSQPVAGMLSSETASIIGRIQDESPAFMDSPPDVGAFYTKGTDVYADDFYSFLDKLWEGDQNPGDQAMAAIASKVVSRILAKKTAADILADMQELVDDILDADFDRDFNDLASLLGKLLIQADYPLWVDAEGHPVSRDAIDPTLDTNLGVGNAVEGMNTFVNWFNKLMANAQSRELLYGVIRESVKMFDPDPDSPNSEKVKALLRNLEDHFTKGGSVYESNPLYKSAPDDPTYTDTELGQTVREFMPYLAQLLARSDRPISLVKHDEGEEPVYLLREMVHALKSVGYDPDALNMEDSLTMMMQYDLLGRDRTDKDSGAFPASFLESMMFLTCATTNFGFADGGHTGETTQVTNPTTQHGHGAYLEALTLNDSLISMTTNKTMGLLGIYDISFMANDKEYMSRSLVPFTTDNRSDYQFDFNQDYAILKALPTNCSGDLGTPDGGNPNGVSPGKNMYTPYNPTGIGETQLAAWTVNWVVRSCFGGEGPYYYADPNAETVTVNGKEYSKFLRPDGRVYALVNMATDPWEYIYPTDGDRDAEDMETAALADYNGQRQRLNRFKSTWHSDYYMYRRNNLIRTVDNSSGNFTTVALRDGDAAQRLTYHELIPEDDRTHVRACASPEEAFFRNYQWVYMEKKMVLIIPQSLSLMGLGYGHVFMVLEANGWSGLANMRILEENHVWAKQKTDGISDIPGDYRVELKADMTAITSVAVNTGSVYNGTLGRGHSTPAIVGKNLPALYRLAFPISPEMDRGNGVIDVELGSREFEVGDEIWQRRNAVAPAFVSLLYAIDKHRVLYPDFDPSSLQSGIHGNLNNLVPLIKPLMFYAKNGEGNIPPYDVWKVRVQSAPNSEDWAGEPYLRPSIGFSGNQRWDGTDDEWTYYQPAVMKNFINVLIDSDIMASVTQGKRMDGILPVMAENRAVTNLFKILMSDINDTNELYSALEQITGAVKYTEGQLTAINRPMDSAKKLSFPDWMFAQGTGADEFGFYTEFTGVRPEDIILDIGLDRLVGHNSFDDGVEHEGYGLAYYVDDQEALSWADFDKDVDAMEDLLHPDSEYSIVESFIDMQDAIFARDYQYSQDQVAGLLYTLGKVFTRFDHDQSRWVVQGEAGFNDLYSILKQRVPVIHDMVKDETGANYWSFMKVNKDMLAQINACESSNGMMPYLLSAMSSDDGAEKIMTDFHTFLMDDIVSKPAPLWTTLADLLADMAQAVDNSNEGELVEKVFESYGFQRNGDY